MLIKDKTSKSNPSVSTLYSLGNERATKEISYNNEIWVHPIFDPSLASYHSEFYQFKRTPAPSSHIGLKPKDDTENERS